ncbi:hypothetical protein [Glycomyces tritici]|uniref:Uncharacterized protein n=1 Tax=Glycomyces tritici TaxID=2665176 RepID=A0ABT7YVV8_9ACTN|nr:hypothetical protein [Glycomyces tritici]MDN3242769.1 hypothetical protein [Glycomyces tritici]
MTRIDRCRRTPSPSTGRRSGWGFLERVATGLWVLGFGQTWGLEKLANAEHLVATD